MPRVIKAKSVGAIGPSSPGGAVSPMENDAISASVAVLEAVSTGALDLPSQPESNNINQSATAKELVQLSSMHSAVKVAPPLMHSVSLPVASSELSAATKLPAPIFETALASAQQPSMSSPDRISCLSPPELSLLLTSPPIHSVSTANEMSSSPLFGNAAASAAELTAVSATDAQNSPVVESESTASGILPLTITPSPPPLVSVSQTEARTEIGAKARAQSIASSLQQVHEEIPAQQLGKVTSHSSPSESMPEIAMSDPIPTETITLTEISAVPNEDMAYFDSLAQGLHNSAAEDEPMDNTDESAESDELMNDAKPTTPKAKKAAATKSPAKKKTTTPKKATPPRMSPRKFLPQKASSMSFLEPRHTNPLTAVLKGSRTLRRPVLAAVLPPSSRSTAAEYKLAAAAASAASLQRNSAAANAQNSRYRSYLTPFIAPQAWGLGSTKQLKPLGSTNPTIELRSPRMRSLPGRMPISSLSMFASSSKTPAVSPSALHRSRSTTSASNSLEALSPAAAAADPNPPVSIRRTPSSPAANSSAVTPAKKRLNMSTSSPATNGKKKIVVPPYQRLSQVNSISSLNEQSEEQPKVNRKRKQAESSSRDLVEENEEDMEDDERGPEEPVENESKRMKRQTSDDERKSLPSRASLLPAMMQYRQELAALTNPDQVRHYAESLIDELQLTLQRLHESQQKLNTQF